MKKNRLKQIITERLYLQNKDKAFGDITIRFSGDEIRDLAKALGCSYSSAYNWYRNKFQPEGDNEYKVAEYYGRSVGEFYYDEK